MNKTELKLKLREIHLFIKDDVDALIYESIAFRFMGGKM